MARAMRSASCATTGSGLGRRPRTSRRKTAAAAPGSAVGHEGHERGLLAGCARPGNSGRRKTRLTQSQSAAVDAEVRRKLDDAAAALLDARAHEAVRLDVGAPETVDRLLRVADDEERARRAASSLRQSALARCRLRSGRRGSRPGSDRCPGIRPRGSAVKRSWSARRTVGSIAQQVARIEQEVLEVQPPVAAPPRARRRRAAGDERSAMRIGWTCSRQRGSARARTSLAQRLELRRAGGAASFASSSARSRTRRATSTKLAGDATVDAARTRRSARRTACW